MQSESRTFNAEKPPKKAVFQRKVVGVQGLEPWASCSQSRRATNCATPRYEVRRSGWAYSPKASALPTALHPDIQFFLHDTMRRRKKQVFRVCGRRCGQARFCESFSTGEFPPQATVPKASGSSLSGKWIGYLSSQKGRHTTNCANLEQTVLV